MFSIRSTVSKAEAKQYNPVVLAFVGDAVCSLYEREKLALQTDLKSGEMQKRTSAKVSAKGQNDRLDKIRPLFTQEEEEIFLRGRNAKKGTRSKAATVAEYNRSTGFEAVMGFLYITGQTDRLDELLSAGEAEEGEKK